MRSRSKIVLLVIAAFACACIQSKAAAQADSVDITRGGEADPIVEGSGGIELCFGAGISDHFWPNPHISPTGERTAGGYQVRLRGYYRSIGGVLFVQRIWGGFGNDIDGGQASAVSLQIAASYHVLFLKDRFRLEVLGGFTHDRDGVHSHHYSDKYDSVFSEIGYMLGGDLVIKIVEGVRLHGTFTHSEYSVDFGRVKSEVLLRLSPLGSRDLITEPRRGEFYLIGGVQHAKSI